MFSTYSAHQFTYENLLKTRLILEMKFDLEIEIFKVKGVCGNFFTIFYVFSASNYTRKPSKNLAYTRDKIWPWIGDFQGQRCLREFFYYFFRKREMTNLGLVELYSYLLFLITFRRQYVNLFISSKLFELNIFSLYIKQN